MKNIVLVMTDQQHFETLGCVGTPEARTPNIDRLAARGILFRNHFVTNPICSPSRASIWTGRYITEHGLWDNGCRLEESIETIPTALGRAGYQSAHFGKLHLVPILNRVDEHPAYGFDVCEVAEGDQQLTHDAHFRWLRQADPGLFMNYVNEMYAKGHDQGYTSIMPEDKHLSTWVTGRAVDWLRARRQAGRPFFLSLGYFDPHHAFNPCEPYASMFADAEVSAPIVNDEGLEDRPAHIRDAICSQARTNRDPQRIANIRRAYHAMVAHVDKCVGDLLAVLDDLGLADDTVVIFTSDHGEMLGNHGLLHKGPFMFDDLLRVPLVVSLPGRSGGGTVCDELTSAVDLKNTMMRLAGLSSETAGPGKAIVDEDLRAIPDGPRDHVVAQWERERDDPARSLTCLRTRRYKYVRYADDRQGELYDLTADPHEFLNLYRKDEWAGVRAELSARLDALNLPARPATRCECGW